ncbi:CNOT2 family protein [Megaselia abdita]
MANLNFQQPPRSIASSSLSGRNTGGFGSSSLSGHVTPTSGMFPPGGANFVPAQPPQLSPNRSAQLSVGGPSLAGGSRGNLFSGLRNFSSNDRRGGMPGLTGGTMVSGAFMQSARSGGGSTGGNIYSYDIKQLNSVFGRGDSTNSPQLLDPSEFPSLTNTRGQNDQSLPHSTSLQAPGSKPYVGMVKQPTSEHSEFQMSNEDFPALPGTQISDGTTNNALHENSLDGQIIEKSISSVVGSGLLSNTNHGHNHSIVSGGAGTTINIQNLNLPSGANNNGIVILDHNHVNDSSMNSDKNKTGVKTSPDGKVTNIPASMVNNQFGMVGLLTFLRAAESDPNLVTLAMGQDLTTLGLNLNSQENLHPTFAGPLADQPCRAQDIEYNVPPEYLVNGAIRDKLSAPQLKKYKEDLLFYLFYTNAGDALQLLAAHELYNRDWRYHIEEKVWIFPYPGITNFDKNGTKERGTFYYFDAQNWRRVPKDFLIDPSKLDKCPNVSALQPV